uniref:DUF4817 domain-containing protein n=1 Tax=Ascaris lumbricoides TaxID=6252 RepID=A0A0M3IQG6_ASCLU
MKAELSISFIHEWLLRNIRISNEHHLHKHCKHFRRLPSTGDKIQREQF